MTSLKFTPTNPAVSDQSSAAVIAQFLKSQGIDTVFALCGGHIMPMWMKLDAVGIKIVDVRDERAAVYMAHAHSELTGNVGVALITAGPGVTNAMTGLANAHVARASVMVLSGLPPTQQENRGALQDMNHVELVKPLTRYARTVRTSTLVLQELDTAFSKSLGNGNEPGPVFLDFPVDTLREEVSKAMLLPEFFHKKKKKTIYPDPKNVQTAIELLSQAKKPLVITGRGAKNTSTQLIKFLDKFNALYLDTGESRGLVPESHPSVVAAVRGSIMGDADLIITIGRKLDFQLAYGSPAIFGNAKFLRIADNLNELSDNRHGDVEIFSTPEIALESINNQAKDISIATDLSWAKAAREKHQERSKKLETTMANSPKGSDGLMHPNQLLAALRKNLPENNIVVADGGDFLSFARVGLPASTYLDPGPLGCIGIGTGFGIAASLAKPDATVAIVTGDGAFGFNAMEIDTAVRHQAPVLIVVANNGSWAIEVRDQQETHGKVVGTHLQFSDYAQMARSFGLHAERVTDPSKLDEAIKNALANRPALLDVVVTPEAASSDAKSGLAWVPNLQALEAWDKMEADWRNG
jgi:acetolactate synthase-1/2/3 large subunit